ncbi:MAG: TIM barrel protein, partial [Bacteroidota bacterium]
MLDLGYVTAIQASHSFEEVISFASTHGFKCLEVMCWPKGKAERRYAGVTHIDVATLDDTQVTYLKDLQEEKGVYISGLGYYPNPLEGGEKTDVYVQHIKDVITAAAKLGVPVVNTFIGREPSQPMDWNIGQFKEVWPEII